MMTTDNNSAENMTKNAKFGTRLKLARESLRLSVKDAAARLHLNPEIISLIENEEYENAPPKIFLRGYLKSYARMLNFSDADIAYALTQIEMTDPVKMPVSTVSDNRPLQSSHPFMRWATFLIILLIAGLVGAWWHTHTLNMDKTIEQASAPIAEPALETQIPATPEAAAAEATRSQATLTPTTPAVPATPSTPKAAVNTGTPGDTADNNTPTTSSQPVEATDETADEGTASDTSATTSNQQPAEAKHAPLTNTAEDMTQPEPGLETSDTQNENEE